MDLLEIRQQVIELSGRADLATTEIDDNDTDNGIDFFIRAATRSLDLAQEPDIKESFRDFDLSEGGYKVAMSGCRYIERVTYIDDEDNELPLVKLPFGNLTDEYPELASTDTGTPAHYSIFDDIRPAERRGLGNPVTYRGIVIMPPTDEDLTLRIYGKFHSLELRENSDSNYWSENYPEVLILATLRELEGFYRNTEGYRDFSLIMGEKLNGIDNDSAAQDSQGGLIMEG